MTVRWQSEERDRREWERQQLVRKEFVESTPAWYRGEMHLGFTLVVTFSAMAWCWVHIHGATVWEWLLIAPIVLFGNWIEWGAHRYILHRPVPGLQMIYKRHVTVHHQFFTHHDLSYSGHKDWRALLFPPFAPLGFVLAAVPPALVAGFFVSANAGYIVVLTMSGYYLLYEGLHTLSHLEDEDYPWLQHVPLINTVRRMHYIHHVLGFMQTRNFNLTFPICDALFGTSDLNRGLVGTLFNGSTHAHMRPELRLDDAAPGPQVRAPQPQGAGD